MSTIAIDFPVEGEWKILRPPGHHPHAFDLVKLDARRKSSHESSTLRFLIGGIPANRYFCWGMPAYAPIAGSVIRVGDGWSDHESIGIWKAILLWYNANYRFRPQTVNGRLDIRPNAGNYVMIMSREGFIVFLAHLRNGSIVVQEGSRVGRGDLIGEIGNSGNLTMPHLHVNVFDQMTDPYSAKVLPFVFNRYELLSGEDDWDEHRLSQPHPGNIVKFHIHV